MEPKLLPPPPRMQLIVAPTRDIVEALREDLAPLSNVNCNLDEIGSVFVESFNKMEEDDPQKHWNLRDQFSDHFARQHVSSEDEYLYALEKYKLLFERLEIRLRIIGLKRMGSHNHYGISFHQWLGGDLVIAQHLLPY